MAFQKIIDVDSVKLLIQKWLVAVINTTPAPATQIPVIYDWQSGTKPGKPYVAYTLTGSEKRTVIDDVDVSATPALTGQRFYHLEINGVADDETAGEMIEAVRMSLEQPQFYGIIELGSASLSPPPSLAFNCSISAVSEPVDLTSLLDTKYERRTMLELELIVSYSALLDDGTPSQGGVETVQVSGDGGTIEMDVDAVKP
jgi:hypothetical protein